MPVVDPKYFHETKNIEWIDEDLYAVVKCPCGNELIFSSSNEEETCGCGKEYQIKILVEVSEPEQK